VAASTLARTAKNKVSQEERATPALTLFKDEPAFKTGFGRWTDPLSPFGEVLFEGTWGATVGEATVVGGVAVGVGKSVGVGVEVCIQAGCTIAWSAPMWFIS